MNFLIPIELHARHSAFSLLLTVALMTLIIPLATPQITLSADLVVGGEVQVQEPEVNVQDMQDMEQAQDLDQPEMGVADVAGDADLTIVVPVELENLYLNVDQGKIRCRVYRYVGQREDMTLMALEDREFEIEGGAYSNTFTFYFVAPADMDFDQAYSYTYMTHISLKDSTSGDGFYRVLSEGYNADLLEGRPQWSIMSTASPRISSTGEVNW